MSKRGVNFNQFRGAAPARAACRIDSKISCPHTQTQQTHARAHTHTHTPYTHLPAAPHVLALARSGDDTTFAPPSVSSCMCTGSGPAGLGPPTQRASRERVAEAMRPSNPRALLPMPVRRAVPCHAVALHWSNSPGQMPLYTERGLYTAPLTRQTQHTRPASALCALDRTPPGLYRTAPQSS
jgi:hypothetical protein